MNKKIVVSVIVVTYNSRLYIEKCLDSLVKQGLDVNEFEILISDGLSKDGTVEVAESILKSNGLNYKILINKNVSLASGWNLALKHAVGEFVVRPDAHAELHAGYIKSGVYKLSNDHSLAGVGGVLITKSTTFIGDIIACVLSSRVGVGNSLFRVGVEDDTYTDTAVYAVYKKCVFDEVGLFNEDLARNQDIDMHKRMTNCGYMFLTSPEMRATYHSRSSFSGFVRQAFSNGFWIAKSRRFHARHLAPLFFVLILFILNLVNFKASVILFSLYLSVLIFYFTFTGNHKISNILLLSVMTFSLHLSYGIGTIFGFLQMKFKLKWFKR